MKVKREKFNRDKATEQFEKYKETGKSSIVKDNPNKIGYSELYAEGWSKIFEKKEPSD